MFHSYTVVYKIILNYRNSENRQFSRSIYVTLFICVLVNIYLVSLSTLTSQLSKLRHEEIKEGLKIVRATLRADKTSATFSDTSGLPN